MDNSPTIYQPSSVRNKTNWSMILLVILFVVILGFVATNYFELNLNFSWLNTKPPQISPNSPKIPPLPTLKPTTSPELSFKGCDIKKENNPLVQGVKSFDDRIVGTLYGNINTINFNKEASSSAKIQLVSPQGDQTYTFTLDDEPNLVYDAVALKNLKLNNLKPGLTVTLTFNCYPKNNNLFKFTHVAVMGDTTK